METDTAPDVFVPKNLLIGNNNSHTEKRTQMDTDIQSTQIIENKMIEGTNIPEKIDFNQFCTPIFPKMPEQQQENIVTCDNLCWMDLNIQSHLADGAMCRVFNAVYLGKQCVVKTVLPFEYRNEGQTLEEIERHLEDELAVLKKVQHPNCITYYGSGRQDNGELFIVLERLEKILVDVIGYRYCGKYGDAPKPTKYKEIDAIKWAMDLSQVFSYFNGAAIPFSIIIHRDLKSENIGFGSDGNVKILDLGLSKIVNQRCRLQSNLFELSGGIGSLRYMAPEVALCRPYNEKADVYSFGIVFWEMLSRKEPYRGMDYEEFMEKVVHKGKRPRLNKKWGDRIRNLLEQCWSPDINERPAFSEITGHLEGIMMDEINKKMQSKQQQNEDSEISFFEKMKSAVCCRKFGPNSI